MRYAQEVDVALDEAALQLVDRLTAATWTSFASARLELRRMGNRSARSRPSARQVGVDLRCFLAVADAPEAGVLGNDVRGKQADKRCLQQQHHDDVADDAQRQRQAEALDAMPKPGRTG